MSIRRAIAEIGFSLPWRTAITRACTTAKWRLPVRRGKTSSPLVIDDTCGGEQPHKAQQAAILHQRRRRCSRFAILKEREGGRIQGNRARGDPVLALSSGSSCEPGRKENSQRRAKPTPQFLALPVRFRKRIFCAARGATVGRCMTGAPNRSSSSRWWCGLPVQCPN
jgi:hypothetical protein